MRQLRFSMVAAAAALVVACGGGSSNVGGGGGAATGSQVGVLTDAQVQGVQYTTTSGVSGTTDALGQYNYNPGDTVTFKIGNVTLGAVPATGIVTPVQLAAGNDDKLINLLVMLQSLDADGNPANGIVIPAAASTALAAAIDLTAPLAGAAMTALTNAQTAAGLAPGLKSEIAAATHFLGQARSLMASNVWVARADGTGKPEVVLYFNNDGHYLIGNFEAPVDGTDKGFESGRVTADDLDAEGFHLAATVTTNANGQRGLSDAQPDERFAPDGDKITVTDNIEQVIRTKMDNDPTGIVGAWRFSTANALKSPATDGIVLFMQNGYFALVNTLCGGHGVELGKYSYNAGTGAVTPSAMELNTSTCAVAMFDGTNTPVANTITIAADGKTAVWQSGITVNLVRVSR